MPEYVGHWKEVVSMVKRKPKKEKPEESAEDFVKRVNRDQSKSAGLKQRFVWQRRRHYSH